jgi:hypothetical protein
MLHVRIDSGHPLIQYKGYKELCKSFNKTAKTNKEQGSSSYKYGLRDLGENAKLEWLFWLTYKQSIHHFITSHTHTLSLSLLDLIFCDPSCCPLATNSYYNLSLI